MIMEEVMVMEKVQEKQKQKTRSYMLWQKRISSATVS